MTDHEIFYRDLLNLMNEKFIREDTNYLAAVSHAIDVISAVEALVNSNDLNRRYKDYRA